MVQRLTEGARGLGRATTRDGEIDTLRVVLRAVGTASGVEGNNLVADDIVTRGEGGWDSEGPGVVLRDEVLRGPRAG